MSRALAWIALASACLWSPVARADGDGDRDSGGARRMLAGHMFIPSVAVTDPFVSTNVGLDSGTGYAWIDGPGFDRTGARLGSESFRTAALAQTAAFQLGLARWFAARLTAGGGIDGGVNARSAIAVGVVQPISAGFGATASAPLGDKLRVGLVFDFTWMHERLIQPLASLGPSLEAGRVVTAAIDQRFDSFTFAPGGSLGFVPMPWLGILASGQYIGTVFDNSHQEGFVRLGASGQIDLRPVGVLASYSVGVPVMSTSDFTHTLEAAVFYTGRRELDLGLDFELQWFDLRPDSPLKFDTKQLLGLVRLRYHWN